MLKPSIEKAINQQIQREFESAYLYLGMGAEFESMGLGGFAHWMRIQFAEEQMHAMRFFDYVVARGGRVVLEAIAKPQTEFGSAVKIFEKVLEHERKVTAYINEVYALAVKEIDPQTQSHLHWFIDEQVEEEKNAEDILTRLKAVEGHDHFVFMMDKEMSQRPAPTPPQAST